MDEREEDEGTNLPVLQPLKALTLWTRTIKPNEVDVAHPINYQTIELSDDIQKVRLKSLASEALACCACARLRSLHNANEHTAR